MKFLDEIGLSHFITKLKGMLNSKVDKVSGKQLSTEDYSTIEKNKLNGIETGANKYTHPSTHPYSMITGAPTSLPASGGQSTTTKHLVGDDTRNANSPPSAYMSSGNRWAGRAGWQTEFKYRSTIGSPSSLSGTYVYLQTHTPWSDPSGGYPVQIAYGNGAPSWRVGVSNSAWSDWESFNDNGNAATVNGKTVLTDVPADAKFTDTNTRYSEITTAEIDLGTASTLRTITARRVKYILDKISTMITTAISSLNKSSVGLDNVDNTSDLNKPISTAQQSALNLKADKTELHNHTNKFILDKFTEVEGKPLYNGEEIGGGGLSQVITVEGATTLGIASNTVAINIPSFVKDRDTLIVYKNSVFADGYTISQNGLNIIKNSGVWDAGTVFNFVAFQVAELPTDTGLLDSLLIIRREEFTATQGQTTFNLSLGEYVPNGNRLSVYIWGTKQYNNAFTETNGTSFKLAAGLDEGDKVIAEWIETVDVTGFYGGHAHTHAQGGGDELTAEMLGIEFPRGSVVAQTKPSDGTEMWYEEVV